MKHEDITITFKRKMIKRRRKVKQRRKGVGGNENFGKKKKNYIFNLQEDEILK